MKKRTRLVAFLIMLCMVIGLLPGFGGISAAAASDPWAISINRITLAAELRTVETKRAYDGTLYEVEYVNTPTEGMCYAVVTMTASKLDPSATLDLSSARLYLKNGGSYLCLADSAFLSDHNYTVFGSDRLLVSASGSIAFEIPEDSLQADTDGWYLVCGGITSGASNSAASEVPQSSMEVARQDEIEAAVLARYEAARKATLANAMVVQDVYDNAPLTAVALFETEAACSVTVTVQGHTDDADITYTVGGEVTHHEVPIFGLYAGETNTVTVTAGEESHDLSITTEDVPAKLTTITPSDANDVSAIAEGQLYLLQDPYHVIFDRYGEIRWYMNPKYEVQESSGPFNLAKGNTGFWFAFNPACSTVYSSCTEIICMNWIGKIENLFSYEDYRSSHDGTILPNGHFLHFADWSALYDVDPLTGEMTKYLELADILDVTVGNLNAEDNNNPYDWLHVNTVEYVPANNSLLLSLRNQHMIIDLDYETKEPIWVMTPASSYNAETREYQAVQEPIKDTVVLPAAEDETFEWFYCQHDPTFISYDAENQIFDYILFDNGSFRYVVGHEQPNNLRYSRIVHYSVDIQDRTVRQVFEYGKGEGERLYSCALGSAEKIAVSGNYLGNYRCHNLESPDSIVDEVAPDGTFIAEYVIGNLGTFGSYRANALFLPAGSFSNCNFTQSTGVEYHRYNQTAWETCELPEKATEALTNNTITSISTDGNTISLYGLATVANSAYTVKTELVAVRQDRQAYSFSMGVCNTSAGQYFATGEYYGKGIPLDTLPDGVYTLYIRGTNGRGLSACETTGYTLTKGDSDFKQAVNADLLHAQSEADAAMQAMADAGDYTLQSPLVVVDPYGISPLSALAMFETARPATISVTVKSKAGADDITADLTTRTTSHAVPIYGLYAEEATNVILTAHYADGSIETSTISVTGNSLPYNFYKESDGSKEITMEANAIDREQMADGLTFVVMGHAQRYTFAVDENGDVRWALGLLDTANVSGITVLKNGHLLVSGNGHFGAYYKYSVFETDLTGKIYQEYMVDGAHHDAIELPNGNLLIAANNVNGKVVEDTIYEMDRASGDIVRVWDLNSYFNVLNVDANGQHCTDINYGGGSDWFHNNSVEYDPSDNSMILSSRHQDAIIKISLTTGELVWILSDPNDLWSEDQQAKLLKPVGDDFEYQYGNHCVKLQPNGDLMVFDNGDYRSKTAEGIVPATEGYSRVVVYRIDEENLTVQQVSVFGKDEEGMGADTMAAYVSGESYLGENHYLYHFGGICKDAEGNATYNQMQAIFGGSSQTRIYEVKDGQIIYTFNMDASGLMANTFRSLRMSPYTSLEEFTFAEGQRMGGLFARGAAVLASMPEGDLTAVTDRTVSDDGKHLTVTCEGVPGDSASVYFVGLQQTYAAQAAVENGTASLTISDSELLQDEYLLYLVAGETILDLQTLWTNTADRRPFPTAYQITAVSDNDNNGAAFGTGIYYKDTILTLTAIPRGDNTFTGWQKNGQTVSTNAVYSFIPTEDAVYTAVFAAPNEGGDSGSGGGSGSGGSSGGGGSAGGGGASGSIDTTTNPDGSSTTTTTDKTTGAVTETTTGKPVTDEAGNTTQTTTESVTNKDGSTVETVTETVKAADGSSTETKTEVKTDANGVTTSTETVKATDTTGTTAEKVTETNAAGETTTTVAAAVSDKAVTAAAESGAPVTLPVEVTATTSAETAPVVKVEVPTTVSEVKVEVPVENVTPGTVVVIVREDGTEEIVKATTMGENGVVVPLDGSATVKIVDNSKTFDDVAAADWESDAVAFVSAREIFNGTGDATFDPGVDMTRGMMVTVLARYAGANTEGGEVWYDKGLEWAKENGVSDGSNPTGKLTREQMAVMLYRYAGSPDIGGQELNFPDAGNVSDFAANAMRWAVETGLINGMDGNLNPQGYATRAQLAAILMRFCQNVAQ